MVIVALTLFWPLSPVLPPDSYMTPLLVASGPTAFLRHARFSSTMSDSWGWVSWYAACLLVCAPAMFFAVRAERRVSRITAAVVALILWLLSGVVAIALMI